MSKVFEVQELMKKLLQTQASLGLSECKRQTIVELALLPDTTSAVPALQMLRNLFLGRPSRFPTFCKYLYWSPIPMSLIYFLEIKQVSGQSMKVFVSGCQTVYICSHPSIVS